MTDTISNSALIHRINKYWAARGAIANARIEVRTFHVSARTFVTNRVKSHRPGYSTTIEVIVSDIVNGYPVNRSTSIRAAA